VVICLDRTVCNMANENNPSSVQSETNKPSSGLLVIAIVLTAPAIALGLFVVCSLLFPGRCGDFSGAAALTLVLCGLFNLPIGFFALGVGLRRKTAPQRLRKTCIAAGLLTLGFPVLGSGLLEIFPCR
jgi:hypothetical protein